MSIDQPATPWAPAAQPEGASTGPSVRARPPVEPAAATVNVDTTEQPPLLPVGLDESYTVELVRDPFPYVSVTFVSHGSTSGSTRVGLDHWGGINDPQNEVHGLTVTDERGRPLAIEADGDQAKPDADASAWTVHHNQGALLVVHYAVVPPHHDVGWDALAYRRSSDHDRPVRR